MSSESSRRRRGLLTYWVPVVVTVTVATVGIAAWAWSQRNEDDEEEEEETDHAPGLDYEHADYGDNPAYGSAASRAGLDQRTEKATFTREVGASYGVTDPSHEGLGWSSQMTGALRRTPSPQQFLSNAGKTVAAGVAGVGAAVGSALSSIREEDKNAYADHETWSEEAVARKARAAGSVVSKADSAVSKDGSKRRKTVAVVVSADTNVGSLEDDFHEHASILSHVPRNTDFTKTKLFFLIYSPELKDAATDVPSGTKAPPSLSSSFSNIGHDQAQTPKDEKKSPALSATHSAHSAFNAVYSQALALVEKETMVMPFTSADGHQHMLRHIEPDVIYLQESLAGTDGGLITRLQSWFRYDVILVVGADGGHGGLADSESEAERPDKKKQEPWWHREDRVGRGRGVVVVDSLRLGDDWARRVQGKD